MSTRWERIARETVGDDYAQRYAERFRAMAARGEDAHGEAAFVADLVDPPARVLDAGCGTGRVAVRLAELGYAVVGVDLDGSMLEVARAEAPDLDWRRADLARLDLGETFDVVLVAGNTIPLLDPGTLLDACERLGAHVTPGGVVVCGFGLDAAHLPGDCPPTALADVDAAFGVLGMDAVVRYGTWDHQAFDPADGYAVTLYAEPRR
ncbi:methyltransferase domain-containing protein [Nocardioides sp. MAH-18]|uniref:Methyltransferase domain-containing protein n=1 Tax=Nocardioides agri TaxID=2682843 RepID=A0A6L6XSY9_9ACTN|nr:MULTISPECIES: methyltransferase domain-containing protein [unclassified Nocardioides]MBA2955267.1 methyltransferase domain-containing protein [Nocardioides sp. CGMCC 1.13656]MVQ50118.1 methyltransferase domain-containing protein [Nocardioides sp. MAH-18]